MAAEAKFIISAQDKTASAIQSVKKSFYIGDKAVEAFSEKLTKLASISALTILAKKIGDFSASCIQDFAVAERAQLRMGDSFSRLSSVIDTLGKKYNGSKDDIEGVVSALNALGKSDSQIEAITRASIHLANTTGQDLNSSYLNLAETFEGKVSAKLVKLLPELGELTDKQLEAGGATDLINQKLDAMTERLAGGVAQKITNLAESFGDLKEAIGSEIFSSIDPFLTWLTNVVDKITEYINKVSLIRNSKINVGTGKGNEQEYQAVIDLQKKDIIDSFSKDVKKITKSLSDEQILSLVSAVIRRDKSGKGFNVSDSVAKGYGVSREEFSRIGREISDSIKKATDKQMQGEMPMIDQWIDSIDKIDDYSKKIVELKKETEKINTFINPGALEKTLSKAFQVSPLFGADFSRLRFPVIPGVDNGTGDGGSVLGSSTEGLPLPKVNTSGTDLGFNFNPFEKLGKFGEIVTKVVSGLDSFYLRIAGMVMSLDSVTKIMNPMLVLLQGVMNVLGPALDQILKPVIGIITLFGQFLGSLVVPALNALVPVVEFITKAFVWLYNKALVPFQNGMVDVIQNISNFFIDAANAVLSALDRIPGVNVSYLSRANLSGTKLSEIDYKGVLAAGGYSNNSYGSGGGASYTGSQNITINIYQNAPMVGSNGMREFTLMLRDELDTLGYYNQ